MINVDDWAEIRRLYFAEQLGIKAIARQLGVARNTVRTAVRVRRPAATTSGKPRGSLVDAVEPEICELLKDCPTMPATVIAERIGWAHGITILRDRVAELRPLFRPPDPCQRTHYAPGELVQFDLWQPDDADPARLRPGRQALGGHRGVRVLALHGGVDGPDPGRPRRAGRHAAVLRADRGASHARRSGTARAASASGAGASSACTEEFQRFRGTLGMGARLCKPNDPEAKGMNERANGYYETSFLPGRRFDDVDDFNDQLTTWLKRANRRVHATTRAVPAELIYEDRGAMRPFPPVLPDPA